MNRSFALASLRLALGLAVAAVLVPLIAGGVQAAKSSAAVTTITLWHDESDAPVLNQVVAAFHTQYPSITVQASYYDTDTLFDLYTQAASAGAGPDLVRGGKEWIVPFAENGLLHPVGADFDLSLFIAQASGGALWDGQHWGVPDTFGNHLILFYNKSLLASAPANTNDMISAAKSLTGGGQYGLVYHLDEPFWLIPWLTGHGGWVLDEDADPIAPTLNTPAMADALQFIQDFRWKHGIVPTGDVDYETADALFRSGQAAMIINGDWSLAAYRDHFGDDNLGVARIPLVSSTALLAEPMVMSDYYMLNVNSTGERLAAAKLFIEFATSKPAQDLWPQYVSKLPALLQALNDAVIQGDPILRASASQARVGRLQPTSGEMDCVWEAMKVQIPLVMADLAGPASAAAAMQADASACITELHRRDLYLPLIMHLP